MISDGQGLQGYGPASTRRLVTPQPLPYDGSSSPSGMDTNPSMAVGDHLRPIKSPRVTVQRAQVEVVNCLEVANSLALVQNTAMTVRSPDKEALRSEVAQLKNQVEYTQIYANHCNDEQRKSLIEESQRALIYQNEECARISEHYEQEAREIARQEAAAAANQTENALQAQYCLSLNQAEGDLSQHRLEERSVISQYCNALRHSEEEISEMSSALQQQQDGLTAAYSDKARFEEQAWTHMQQMHLAHTNTEEKARLEVKVVNEEQAKCQALLRQANLTVSNSSTSNQNYAEELYKAQLGVTQLHSEL